MLVSIPPEHFTMIPHNRSRQPACMRNDPNPQHSNRTESTSVRSGSDGHQALLVQHFAAALEEGTLMNSLASVIGQLSQESREWLRLYFLRSPNEVGSWEIEQFSSPNPLAHKDKMALLKITSPTMNIPFRMSDYESIIVACHLKAVAIDTSSMHWSVWKNLYDLLDMSSPPKNELISVVTMEIERHAIINILALEILYAAIILAESFSEQPCSVPTSPVSSPELNRSGKRSLDPSEIDHAAFLAAVNLPNVKKFHILDTKEGTVPYNERPKRKYTKRHPKWSQTKSALAAGASKIEATSPASPGRLSAPKLSLPLTQGAKLTTSVSVRRSETCVSTHQITPSTVPTKVLLSTEFGQVNNAQSSNLNKQAKKTTVIEEAPPAPAQAPATTRQNPSLPSFSDLVNLASCPTARDPPNERLPSLSELMLMRGYHF